jgi:hypothetical protein
VDRRSADRHEEVGKAPGALVVTLMARVLLVAACSVSGGRRIWTPGWKRSRLGPGLRSMHFADYGHDNVSTRGGGSGGCEAYFRFNLDPWSRRGSGEEVVLVRSQLRRPPTGRSVWSVLEVWFQLIVSQIRW